MNSTKKTTSHPAATEKQMALLALENIRASDATQARAAIDWHVVDEYDHLLRNHAKFPPLTVFHDGKTYWLADGHHRYHALAKIWDHTFPQIECEVHKGTQRDALLFAISANGMHGLRLTDDDKRRSVELLLRDAEWRQRSSRWIAKVTHLSTTTVGKYRRQLSKVDSSLKRVGQDGKSRSARTPKPPAPEPPERLPLDARYANIIDSMAELGGEDVKKKILSGVVSLPVDDGAISTLEAADTPTLRATAKLVAGADVQSVEQALSEAYKEVNGEPSAAPIFPPPFRCHNCGHDKLDDDDAACEKCLEPVPVSVAKAAAESGRPKSKKLSTDEKRALGYLIDLADDVLAEAEDESAAVRKAFAVHLDGIALELRV